MILPKKFEQLAELTKADIEIPDYVWLTYAVCVLEEDSCGWGGWMIEAGDLFSMAILSIIVCTHLN